MDWYHIKSNAQTRGLSFRLTQKQAWLQFERQKGLCALSGVPLVLDHLKGQTASLDRVDSTRGYSPNNIQWIHKDLNTMKMDLTQETFLRWVRTIYKHKQLDGVTPVCATV